VDSRETGPAHFRLLPCTGGDAAKNPAVIRTSGGVAEWSIASVLKTDFRSCGGFSYRGKAFTESTLQTMQQYCEKPIFPKNGIFFGITRPGLLAAAPEDSTESGL
jgi:hypothetical protein